ncbi:MAG: TetR/AcrR family transcriptional regulator [Bacteroidota bacterium]
MELTDIQPLSDRKQEILQTATRLFSEKGFLASTMRDLAKLLNIQPPSLYSHYESKDEILWEIAVRCAKIFNDRVLPIAQEEGSIEKRLQKMIREHAACILDNQEAAAIFFHEWEHLVPERHQWYAGFISMYEKVFADLIEEGKQKGIFRDIPAKFTTSALLAGISWIHRWYRPNGKMSIDDIGDNLTDFILAGLRNPG